MSDINRVFTHIDGFFQAGGFDRCMALSNVIGRCIAKTRIGYHERDLADEELAKRIEEAMERAKSLGDQPPSSEEECRKAFRELAIESMVLRRSILPLAHPTIHWKRLDPKEALFDDDDQYSFAIYDTLADNIGDLLPDLHKIAVEVAWDADQLG
jgi:hypothetical protein